MFIGGPELELQRVSEIPAELLHLISYARENVPAYRNLPHFHSDSIPKIEDFQAFPVINGNQLAQDPEKFKSKCVNVFRISCSGGTTGVAKILYRTYEDHLVSSHIASEMFKTSTITSKDTVAILQPFDIWGIAFIGLEALRFLQATGIPIGSTIDDRSCLRLFSRFRPSVIYTTPSRANSIADLISEREKIECNWNPRAFLLAGEPITNQMRSKLKRVFDSEVFSIYGSEETDGLGAECSSHAGAHLVEKGIIYELVAPETLLLTKLSTGILVVTILDWRGTVLLRYTTGDLVKLDFSLCTCGKPTPRITTIKRIDEGFYLWDALYITYAQIDDAIQKIFGRLYPYQCIIEGTKPSQVMRVLVDVPKKNMSGKNMIVSLRDLIINSSVELINASNEEEVRVIAQHVSMNRFQKNQRGKIPKVLFKKYKEICAA